jgi:hypothetical protein
MSGLSFLSWVVTMRFSWKRGKQIGQEQGITCAALACVDGLRPALQISLVQLGTEELCC